MIGKTTGGAVSRVVPGSTAAGEKFGQRVNGETATPRAREKAVYGLLENRGDKD